MPPTPSNVLSTKQEVASLPPCPVYLTAPHLACTCAVPHLAPACACPIACLDSHMASKAQKRLGGELKKLNDKPPEGVDMANTGPVGDDILKWRAVVVGPVRHEYEYEGTLTAHQSYFGLYWG